MELVWISNYHIRPYYHTTHDWLSTEAVQNLVTNRSLALQLVKTTVYL